MKSLTETLRIIGTAEQAERDDSEEMLHSLLNEVGYCQRCHDRLADYDDKCESCWDELDEINRDWYADHAMDSRRERELSGDW